MQTRNYHTRLIHKILNELAFALHNYDVTICLIHITYLAFKWHKDDTLF